MGPDSLQEICFSHIVMTLEQFTTDQLSLLPVKFRNHLLLSLSLVDVCRLEDSQFTAGLDMEAIWEQIYDLRFRVFVSQRPQKHWKEEIFQNLLLSTLRASHGSQVRTCLQRRVYMSTSRNDLVDKMNYLIFNLTKPIPPCTCCRYSPLNHDEVARASSGVVSSAKPHVEACPARQCIPPRYESLLPEGSCHLPNSAAFELICNKCRFYPKKLNFSISELSKFFAGVENAKDYFIPLTEFFKNVEKLAIKGGGPIVYGRSIRGARKSPDGIPSTLLRLILNHSHPKLDTLTFIRVSTSVIDLSVSAILASSYSGLKALTLSATDMNAFFNLELLIPFIERQSSLHTISLAFRYKDITHNCTLLSLCFKKPSLQHFNLGYYSSGFLLEILTLFLSTPCSHEQTLTLTDEHPFRRYFSRKLPQLSKKSQSTVCTSTPKLPQFDDTLTLQYKSVVLIGCSFGASFIDSLLKLKCLKLKQLLIDDVSFFKLVVLNDFFDVNILKLRRIDFKSITSKELDCLLQKKSLNMVSLISCRNASPSFRKLAPLHGFDVEKDRFGIETRYCKRHWPSGKSHQRIINY